MIPVETKNEIDSFMFGGNGHGHVDAQVIDAFAAEKRGHVTSCGPFASTAFPNATISGQLSYRSVGRSVGHSAPNKHLPLSSSQIEQ